MRRCLWFSWIASALFVVGSPALRVLGQPPKEPKTTGEQRAPATDVLADLEITLSEDAVTRIAAAAMPLNLKGTNKVKVELPVVGFAEVEASWTAVITNPKISFAKGVAHFEANADVSAAPLNYQDRVHGKLDVSYDKKRNQLVVKTKDVNMNLNLRHQGVGAAVKVDIADQMPTIDVPVGLPTPVLKVAKKTMRAELTPKIEYLEGRVRVSSPLKIVGAKNSPKAN